MTGFELCFTCTDAKSKHLEFSQGLKFLFENFQFLPQVFSWLVGLVGLLVF